MTVPAHNSAARVAPTCPRCGGRMHDNRGDKASPHAPDFRCKNMACLDDTGRRTAVWVRDLERAAAKSNRNGAGAPAASDTTPMDFQTVARLHARCVGFVLAHEAPKLEASGGDVAGVAAALAGQLFAALEKRA